MYYSPPLVPYSQYNNAYPKMHYQQPPSAANGYGWHGNGFGWQLDPKAWHTPPLYPSLGEPAVEEPQIQAQKVEKVNAWNGPIIPNKDVERRKVYQSCLHDYNPSIESRSSLYSQSTIGTASTSNGFAVIKEEECSFENFSNEIELQAQNYTSMQSTQVENSGLFDKYLQKFKNKPLFSNTYKASRKRRSSLKSKSVGVQVGKQKKNVSLDEILAYGESNTTLRSSCCFISVRKSARRPSVNEVEKSSSWFDAYRRKIAHLYDNGSIYQYQSRIKTGTLSFVPNKLYNYGEKGSGFQTKGAAQDFYELRDNCLRNGQLFEDPEFPPTDSSLYFSQRPDRHFEWKRPSELVDNPQLFVQGFSRFDVQQGELGDCWLLAAVANLTLYRRLFFQIVPDDQSFEENYAGIFHFRFWQYGRWIDVVIDDLLPTYRGQLVFLHSTEENEFWSALLEKAYAKLHGSYEALKGGSTCEAMEDFTGGVTEMYEMDAAPPNLFKIIMKAYERWSLMGCSIEPDPNVLEAQTPEGLIRGHAYSITKVQYVDIQTPNVSGKIPLLRLRNPWGNESEWNGAWSDHAPEWQYISDDVKEELGLNFDGDGEFWMSFKDFTRYFSRLEICNLNPDSLSEDELTEGRNKKWEMSVFEGEWVRGVTAGGCRNFLDTFAHNPQYNVTLTEVDEGDDENNCTMIVALMQKNRRQIRSRGEDLLTIGFAIYHLPYPDRVPKPLDVNFFKFNASVARSPSFINLREVSCRFKLPPGTYCIVPSTFDPNEEGEFILRVFSENQNNMEYEGSFSDSNRIRRSGGNDEDNETEAGGYDPPPSHGSSPYPSNPFPAAPNPYPSNPYPPSNPTPFPTSPYPPSSPYPNNPYPPAPGGYPPYPQTPYGQYPQYPQNPQYPPPPNPGYPSYPGGNGNGGGGGGSRSGEHDQEIGLRKIEDKVKPKPTQEKEMEKQHVYKLFKDIAGADNEVDWIELKNILDENIRVEETAANKSNGAYSSSQPSQFQSQTTHTEQNNAETIIATVLSLLCGALCKDTPLADIIPPPSQQYPIHRAYFENKSKGFSKDCCRSMIAMLDYDKSGRLNFEEFAKLWENIETWKNVFKICDKDQNGTLSGFELKEALSSAGYNLNNHILNVLMHRYGNKSHEIDFDDFIMCATRLKKMIEFFQASSGQMDTATFTKEHWIETTLYS